MKTALFKLQKMLKPANVIFTIISFSIMLSFTGYLKGNRTPYSMYVALFLIIISGIYAAIYIIKSFEKKTELKSLSLAFFGLIYAITMKGYISILTLSVFLHLILFTPIPKEYPDIHASMGNYFFKNIQMTNKIILSVFIVLVFCIEIFV